MLVSMATVSVVIPSLNDAEMLRHCLAALDAQTRPADEVIVVDNGSTDDTSQVAEAWGARVVHEPVRGVLRATAAGLDAARGEIIGRLDADSRPDPSWVARLEQRFDIDPTLDAITGNGWFYGGNGFWHFVGRYCYIGGYLFLFRVVLGRMPLFGSNFAIRRAMWRTIRDRVHVNDPRTHDDLDISFAFPPEAGVDFDPHLHVGVSARPFTSWNGFTRRVGWAFSNIARNFREVRWSTRVISNARGRRARRLRQQQLGVPTRVPLGVNTGHSPSRERRGAR